MSLRTKIEYTEFSDKDLDFFKKIKKPQQESQRLEGFEKECKELNERSKDAFS